MTQLYRIETRTGRILAQYEAESSYEAWIALSRDIAEARVVDVHAADAEQDNREWERRERFEGERFDDDDSSLTFQASTENHPEVRR